MADETEVIETAAPEGEAIAAEAPAGGQQEQSVEDRALTMGWTPQGQFKGDPEKWVDAETFVKRGEEFLPFLKANNRRLEQALERANTKLEQMDKGLRGAIQQLSRSEKRAYDQARADLEAELEQYAAAGNADAVKAVTKDIVDLERETVAKADDEPAGNPDFEAWREANPWFGKDKALTAACGALGAEVAEEGYTGKAQIKEVDRRIREAFPEKFAKPENPLRRQPGAVEGTTQNRPAGKTFGDLPSDAKQMCDELCRTIKGFSREKYVKDYFAEEKK